ncbi:peptidase S8/S53 domain-containing protein [Paraphoma chrysanthemicola]|uniref:Peptidase S8/S53 domain-containing protein n=1 Tax=Paraphoma chrysanthemicola TaxID=798071 RepID=A0A8K0VU78_9PLEO|nr:peptidase S8/S53 domain-containing protein [Paraphoma chrysanthemicola]
MGLRTVSAAKRVKFREEFASIDEDIEVQSVTASDICHTIREVCTWQGQRVPLRFDPNATGQGLSRRDPEFVQHGPRFGQPMTLHEVLSMDTTVKVNNLQHGRLLSARTKVHLAFVLSKAIWQFYESDWMGVKWAIDSIVLLPRLKDRCPDTSLNMEAEVPYLKIDDTAHETVPLLEEEPTGISGQQHYHPYPYILNLGILLVLICSDKINALANHVGKKDDVDLNSTYFAFQVQVYDDESSWPCLDLSDDARERYREIVKHCVPLLPNLRSSFYETITERRATIRDKVVLPLYELLRGMKDPTLNDPEFSAKGGFQVTREDGISTTTTTKGQPSIVSKRWITRITSGGLHTHLLQAFDHNQILPGLRRPKIAIIDTGYDPTAGFFERKHRLRFNIENNGVGTPQYHFRDFWQDIKEPCDVDGHGTSMLSIIMMVAPFADICVARIASSSKDLHDDAVKTSDNLAKAIRWAVKEHDVDIISMSFGWEEEELVDGYHAVSKAISKSMNKRDQKLLVFAAASNLGGAHEELFPAHQPQVFSIRATNSLGAHQDFNPNLSSGATVYGTLGLDVPAAQPGKTKVKIGCTGTSAATAVAAGIAAHVVGYVHAFDQGKEWSEVRKFRGFSKFLDRISTHPARSATQERFLSLEKYHRKNWQKLLHADLDSVQ